jgi:hypothetical protein
MDKEKYLRKRKITSKVILITMYTSFIGYMLGDIQGIANWNYSVHEMLYMPMSVAYFAIPIQALVWLYYAIKSYRYKESRNAINLKLYARNSFAVISLIFIIAYFIIQSHRVSTSGIFEIRNKIYDKRNYYILIDDKKVKCTWNEYNLVEEGKSYLISFNWNNYYVSKAKLEYIEIIK